MKLDRDGYEDFKQVLVGLPFWTDEEKCEVFVKDAVWGHDLLDHIGKLSSPVRGLSQRAL